MKENNLSSENYNIIDYVKIIDLSLLNLLDCVDLSSSETTNTYLHENDKIIIDLSAKNRALLEGFIIDNINNEIYYNRKNIIVNTCTPMKNWRQYERHHAIRNNKYIVIDDSIYIDEIKLNNFASSLFSKIPQRNAILLKKSLYNNTVSSNISIQINKNIKFLEFDNIDLLDVCFLLKYYISPIESLIINNFNYNIIKDGNCDYSHKLKISDEIKEDFRVQLLEKGII